MNLIPGNLYRLKQSTYLYKTAKCIQEERKYLPDKKYGLIGYDQNDIIMFLQELTFNEFGHKLYHILYCGIKGFIIFDKKEWKESIFEEIKS